MNTIKPNKFQIDFLPSQIFDGFTTGEDWNGFACPLFPFEEAKRLSKAWEEIGKSAQYLKNQDMFIFERIDNSGEPEFFTPEIINEQKLYPIGAFSWIWSEVESE